MTDKRCIELFFEFLKAIQQQGYSQDLMEIAGNMFVVIPASQKEQAMTTFTEIAKKGLPEAKYHLEISKIFADIMGYQMPKQTQLDMQILSTKNTNI